MFFLALGGCDNGLASFCPLYKTNKSHITSATIIFLLVIIITIIMMISTGTHVKPAPEVNLGQGRTCPSGDHSFPLRASSIEPSRHHHRHRATTASSSSLSFRKSYILQNIMIPSEDPLDIYMMGKLVKRIVWTSGKSGLFDNWGLRGQRPLDQSALGA